MKIRSVVLAFCLLAGTGMSLSAQNFSLGPELTFGSGTTLFGVSGRYEKSFEKQFSWMGTLGLDFGSGITLITLQGGVKYTINKDLYFGAELGPLFASGGNDSATRFAFTPTIGYKWDKFDLSSRFFLGSGLNLFNIRFAWVFRA